MTCFTLIPSPTQAGSVRTQQTYSSITSRLTSRLMSIRALTQKKSTINWAITWRHTLMKMKNAWIVAPSLPSLTSSMFLQWWCQTPSIRIRIITVVKSKKQPDSAASTILVVLDITRTKSHWQATQISSIISSSTLKRSGTSMASCLVSISSKTPSTSIS